MEEQKKAKEMLEAASKQKPASFIDAKTSMLDVIKTLFPTEGT